MYGKAILGGKTRGHPKGRGLRMDALSVTEGMIAGAAILVSFSDIHRPLLCIADHSFTGTFLVNARR